MTRECQLLRILLIYIINPIGIIHLDPMIHLSLVLLVVVDILLAKHLLECQEVGDRSIAMVEVEINIPGLWVLFSLRNVLTLQ